MMIGTFPVFFLGEEGGWIAKSTVLFEDFNSKLTNARS